MSDCMLVMSTVNVIFMLNLETEGFCAALNPGR
jgi:hypothetical protein